MAGGDWLDVGRSERYDMMFALCALHFALSANPGNGVFDLVKAFVTQRVTQTNKLGKIVNQCRRRAKTFDAILLVKVQTVVKFQTLRVKGTVLMKN